VWDKTGKIQDVATLHSLADVGENGEILRKKIINIK
jgi:hypothetical protein